MEPLIEPLIEPLKKYNSFDQRVNSPGTEIWRPGTIVP